MGNVKVVAASQDSNIC